MIGVWVGYNWLITAPVDQGSALQDAVAALNSGDIQQARKLLDQLNQTSPDNQDVVVLLATVCGLQGDAAEALSLLEALPDFDRNPALILQASQIAMEGHQIRRTEQLLNQLLSIVPEQPEALRLSAYLYNTLQCSYLARPRFVALDRLRLLTAEDVLICCTADRSRYDVDENISQLQESLSAEQNEPRAVVALIENYLTLNNVTMADQVVQQIQRGQYEDDWLIDMAAAAIAIRQADYSSAARSLIKLPEAADQIQRVWMMKGRVLEQLNQLQAATVCFENAALLDPLDPDAPFLWARILKRLDAQAQGEIIQQLDARARKLQTLSVQIGSILSVESKTAAAERLPGLADLLIDVDATREAAVLLNWLASEGYSFAAMDAPRQRLMDLSTKVPPILRSLPMRPLKPLDFKAITAAPSDFTIPPTSAAGLERKDDSHNQQMLFKDVTQQSGIQFAYVCPESDRTEILSSLGGGTACFDIDHDGQADLFFAQGRSTVEETNQPMPGDQCFRNRQGIFEDITASAMTGGDLTAYSHGTAVSDFNNDGFADLLVLNFGENQLWMNQGDGTFQQVTSERFPSFDEWSSSAAFADLDHDGDNDLYVVNYLAELCPEVRVTECGPRTLNAVQDRLLENNADGTFKDITINSGIVTPEGKGLGIVAADFDRNGSVDLFVGNDSTENFLWQNSGAAGQIRLVNQAGSLGVAVGSNGQPQACMGIAFGDVDGNGFPDFFVSNFESETNTFYSNQGPEGFVDQTRQRGLETGSYALMGWGARFLDANLDQRPDLILLNGFLDHRPLRPQMYLQAEDQLKDASQIGGSFFQQPHAGRSLALADLNNDAIPDLIATHRSGQPHLLQNQQVNDRVFSVTLHGTTSAADAIGARVSVQSNGIVVTQDLAGGGGYLSASQATLWFQSGPDRIVDSLTVDWPDGRRDQWQNIQVGLHNAVIQSTNTRTARFSKLP